METRSPPKDIWERSAMLRRSGGLRIFMAKTTKVGSIAGLTPVFTDNVWLFQVNPRDDSFVASAANANFMHIQLCWRYL
jgi:hypothetical protein